MQFIVGCEAIDGGATVPPVRAAAVVPDEFGDYWYQGQAEISSYSLEQARYGALREGTAVTIFVTEDLSRRKQVKLDHPSEAGGDAVKVLKLNSVRKFNTGIYPYSTMTSVFTPVYPDDDSNASTLKVTASVQEWCGQTFGQLNRIDNGYRLKHFSYFESEGDIEQKLPDVLLEDEIWNLIRLRPDDLPIGKVSVAPSMLHQRFAHAHWGAEPAVGALRAYDGSEDLVEYVLSYSRIEREVLIRYQKDFPHEIEYWEENHRSGFGPNAVQMTTRGILKGRIMIDYWTRNRPGDEALREQLAL